MEDRNIQREQVMESIWMKISMNVNSLMENTVELNGKLSVVWSCTKRRQLMKEKSFYSNIEPVFVVGQQMVSLLNLM